MDDKRGALSNLKALLDKQEEVNGSTLEIGDIIYLPLGEGDGLTLTNGYNQRRKYVVIIGFTANGIAVGALLINSNINPSKSSPEMMNCQYPLLARNYRKILSYDSWLDCSDIFEISKFKIIEKNGRLKGRLIDDDRERVMQHLRDSDVIDNATKRRFGII